MKIYKFRPLADLSDLERVESILLTGEFWFSRFWEMNDPMEGYYLRGNGIDDGLVETIFDDKANTLTCSFSKKDALSNPSVWGYYANGFKGLAIEVEVRKTDIEFINYIDAVYDLPVVRKEGLSVRTILSRKLKCWEHEVEVRAFRSSDCDKNKSFNVGKISKVIFGASYPKTFTNPNRFERRQKMISYNCRVAFLRELAEALKIKTNTAILRAGKVEIN